ncbi:Activating signal cointegrator 1 complex subunit 2 [Bienertia sinuspersici]
MSNSNRPSHQRQEPTNFSNNRGFRGKTQQKFMPKTTPNSSSSSSTTTSKPNTSNPNFSASLRQQFQPSNSSSSSATHIHGSRVKLVENGVWVSSARGQSSSIHGGGAGNFVNYLPQDEAVAVGLGAEEGGLDPLESQRVVDLLNRELSRLLRLKPREFWREVAVDASLHEFLDSFLQFRSRWYDFPYHGAKGSVAGVIVGDLELSRRVFMLLYRISSNKDSGSRTSESLSQKDHQGWIFIDDEQYKYLTVMMTHPLPAVSKKLPNAPNSVRSDGLQVEDDAVITESKISQVKDLFPDYGKGFISACLEVYDQNQEEVIQRILEGTLHEDLQKLDTSMVTVPPKPAPSLTKKDKGKGILVEPTEIPTTNSISVSQKPKHGAVASPGSSLTSSVGRFVRKSKGDQPDHETLGSRDEKHMEKTAALLSQYEYEDEYDDSFDDLGVTVESGVEETEIIGDKMSSKSRMSSGVENQGSGSSTANPKWNSKKKPQFYVKDGKNYSYKVEGSVAVADEKQASLVNQAQRELIHGLGRGGNRPHGAVKALEERNEVEGEVANDPLEGDGGRGRGRGRGGGGGRRGGGRNNHYRKDRAMKKHMTGLGGF